MNHRLRVGVSGTGFIACQLCRVLGTSSRYSVSRVLTRRPLKERFCVESGTALTNSIDELVESSDLIVECSGDPLHAADIVQTAFNAALPVITMDAEFQVTFGSLFAGQGYLTESEGDQPGSIAALSVEALAMGFKPVVYGNIKGFLNLDPKRDEMLYWSRKLGISLQQVISFTDGTKIQFEQTLVANGLDAEIAVDGMIGVGCETLKDGALELASAAANSGTVLSDYLLSTKLNPGVFIVATHNESERRALRHYKMGDGPFYILEKPFHLCALEIPKTINRVMAGERPLLNNSKKPRYNTAAVAKRNLRPGEYIDRGIGSFDVRGMAVSCARNPEALPIGVLSQAVIKNPVEAGSLLKWDDVELPDHFAIDAARLNAREIRRCGQLERFNVLEKQGTAPGANADCSSGQV